MIRFTGMAGTWVMHLPGFMVRDRGYRERYFPFSWWYWINILLLKYLQNWRTINFSKLIPAGSVSPDIICYHLINEYVLYVNRSLNKNIVVNDNILVMKSGEVERVIFYCAQNEFYQQIFKRKLAGAALRNGRKWHWPSGCMEGLPLAFQWTNLLVLSESDYTLQTGRNTR